MSQTADSDISEDIPILSDEEVKVGFASTQGLSQKYEKSISWDTTKFSLASARLNVNAKQTYLSGAQLDVIMNDHIVETIHWEGGQDGSKSASVDVVDKVLNGSNTFKLQYSTGFGVITDQLATVSLDMQMTAVGIATGKSPFNQGNTQNKNFWQNLKDNAQKIVLVTAVAAGGSVAAYAAYKVYGGGSMGKLKSLFSKFRDKIPV